MVEDDSLSKRDKEIVERGPGLLTESQRRYLIGQSDIDEGSQRERTVRSRIRRRMINGIHDITLALFRLDERDVQQIEEYFIDSSEMNVLHSAVARLLALHPPSDIGSTPEHAPVDSENDLSFNPDAIVDVVPDSLSIHFMEAMDERYINKDQNAWGVADAELVGKVGFNRVEQPDSVTEDTAEFRRVLTRYEAGEVSKEKLHEAYSSAFGQTE